MDGFEPFDFLRQGRGQFNGLDKVFAFVNMHGNETVFQPGFRAPQYLQKVLFGIIHGRFGERARTRHSRLHTELFRWSLPHPTQ